MAAKTPKTPLFGIQCVGQKKDGKFCGATFHSPDQRAQYEAHVRAEHSDCKWMMDSLTAEREREVG